MDEPRPEQTFFADPALDRAFALGYASWRFPWTVIIAEKPGADPGR